MNEDQAYLIRALELARARRGFCAPNPAVGALVVKEGKILAEGAHQGAGNPHAEVEALKAYADQSTEGATLYVSLEPCNHQGRTPPCTELILERKIARVCYAYADPNPEVAGKGAEYLRAHGVEVLHLPVPEIDEFYQSYAHWLHTRRPYVSAKLALSLDGKIAGPEGRPVSITGLELNQLTHRRRLQSDAILTTVRTIINDNPRLNIRIDNQIIAKPLYILDRNADLPLNAEVFQTVSKITIFHRSNVDPLRLKFLQDRGVHCVCLNELDWPLILDSIGRDGIHDLWVEAGGHCFESLWESKLMNRALFYLSPKTLGNEAYPAFKEAHDFTLNAKKVTWTQMGSELVGEIYFL